MLPSLTAAARRRPPRRAIPAAGGALLLAISLGSALRAAEPTPSTVAPPIAEGLRPGTWAMAVPTSWFIAPIAGLRPGDHLDVLALRPGERASATAVAFDLVVVSVDERAVVVGTGADDATALGVARASGLLLIPLLRSTK
jgi:hypothetical protein